MIARTLSRILTWHRNRRLLKRFEEIVRSTRNSFQCEQYRRRRAAAKKGLGK